MLLEVLFYERSEGADRLRLKEFGRLRPRTVQANREGKCGPAEHRLSIYMTLIQETLFNSRVVVLAASLLYGLVASGQSGPVFLPQYPQFTGATFREPSLLPFRHSQADLQRAINEVVRAVRSDDLSVNQIQPRTVESISRAVKRRVAQTLASSSQRPFTKFEEEWLLAEGVSEYVRWNIYFDDQLAAVSPGSAEQINYATSAGILGRERPGAVCWGISILVRDLARAAGLECYFVNGNSRWLGTPPPKQSDRNHGVACFVFKVDGRRYEVPSDVSIVRGTMQNGKPLPGAAGLKWNPEGKVFSQFILPRTPMQWELFLARFNSDLGPWGSISGDDQNVHLKLKMSYSKWSSVDTDYLNKANQDEVNREETFGKSR